MSSKLRQYLLDAYAGNRETLPEKIRKDFPIQIDDQDDSDNISEFCNIFVIVKKNNCFEIELFGVIPHLKRINDLAEIYGGFCDEVAGRLVFNLSVQQIEVLIDLAKMVRQGAAADNPAEAFNRQRMWARTISSLYRFVRIIKEYVRSKASIL
jgi:hypothetical protein